MVNFKYNCEKCGYGCMASAVFDMHTNRCYADLTESEERKLIRENQLKADEEQKND